MTTKRLKPDQQRTTLRVLGRDRLRQLTELFELDVGDRRVIDNHVDAIVRSRSVNFADVLSTLKRVELKAICEALGLDTGGRELQVFIDRILSLGDTDESTPKPKRSTGQLDLYRKESDSPSPPRKGDRGARPHRGRPGEAVKAPARTGWKVTATKDETNNELEKRLWDAADELRANSKLKSSEYSVPVLGLIFLRYADHKFSHAEQELAGQSSRRRKIGPLDYQARGVMYLPEEGRFRRLLELPEGANTGQAINDAMRAIEAANSDLKDVLPKTYNRLENSALAELLKLMSSIPMDIEGDAFGKIYEYFLGKFAMSEGQKGGEFFTPTCIVKLIVGIIEPFHGRIFDPACGSGGMFVQSARFVEEHKSNALSEISINGQERVAETVRLAQMNLAVHGLGGDIRQGNSYYEDLHNSTAGAGKFDFVMANPPFNVNRVDKERLRDDPRFPFGLPRADNANYLWIQVFYSALNGNGRAGFVMANSASDARGSELEIRRKLIEARAIDVMVAVGSNFFYTVTLPCTLWFLDRSKQETVRADKVLFIDARHLYRQIDRAHRDWTPEQIEFLANIVRIYRGEKPEDLHGGKGLLAGTFLNGEYADVPGLCKLVTVEEIETQGFSLNAGRYVGVAEREEEDFDFIERLEELNEELELLNSEAWELEQRISDNVGTLLEH